MKKVPPIKDWTKAFEIYQEETLTTKKINKVDFATTKGDENINSQQGHDRHAGAETEMVDNCRTLVLDLSEVGYSTKISISIIS